MDTEVWSVEGWILLLLILATLVKLTTLAKTKARERKDIDFPPYEINLVTHLNWWLLNINMICGNHS